MTVLRMLAILLLACAATGSPDWNADRARLNADVKWDTTMENEDIARLLKRAKYPFITKPIAKKDCAMIKPILFILLVAQSEPSVLYNTYGPHGGVVDTWGSIRTDGGVSYPVIMHYKAILFHSRPAFDSYMRSHDIDGQPLIDVVRGQQFIVRQKTIIDTVRVMLPKLREYESRLEEFK